MATLASTLSLTVAARPALAVNPMADLSVVAPPSFQPGDTHNVVAKLDNGGGIGFGPASGGAAVLASSQGSGSDLFKYVLAAGLVLAAAAIMVIMLIRRRRTDDGAADAGGYPTGGGLPQTKSYPAYPYSYDDVGRS